MIEKHKMMKTIFLLFLLTFPFILSSCKEKTTIPTESWAGKWAGPEGTYLELKPVGNAYSITIADLDGPRTFNGVVAQTGIEFERDGKTSTITSGTGEETGMKWLAEKKDCLVVDTGEGYCRD